MIQNFKQISVDQFKEQVCSFYLKEYLENVINSLSPEIKNYKIDIEIDKKIKLYSYPGIFAQIFTNLIMNSKVHGFNDKSSGKITIDAGIKDNQLIINYKDNGKGISPRILSKIFDPFFTTQQQTGTGLGLNIVYNLVTQKLNGSITCESQPEQGVLFILKLPENLLEN